MKTRIAVLAVVVALRCWVQSPGPLRREWTDRGGGHPTRGCFRWGLPSQRPKLADKRHSERRRLSSVGSIGAEPDRQRLLLFLPALHFAIGVFPDPDGGFR